MRGPAPRAAGPLGAAGAFPLSALVDADELRLALLLGAVDRRIGGVLLRGDKGSAKSTAARGLAALLPDGAPFVELPIGATEDRVVGSFDVRAALGGGEYRYRPGLLEAADSGVLYVDEVNLLPDHLVDLLLDAAASGVVRVERDGVSEERSARFVLVGSMNPEEGELRPQLLDRFGLAVVVRAPAEARLRAEAVRRRLAFDDDPETFRATWSDSQQALAGRLAAARPAALPAAVGEAVAELCAAAGAEGLRADLVVCRAACALAGWEGRPEATPDDVARVAGLALRHRRPNPWEAWDPPTGNSHEPGGPREPRGIREPRDPDPQAPPPPKPGRAPGTGDGGAGLDARDGSDGQGAGGDGRGERDGAPPPPPPPPPPPLAEMAFPASARRRRRGEPTESSQGLLVGSRPPGPSGPASVHAHGTVAAAVATAAASTSARAAGGALRIGAGDVREPVRRRVPSTLVVLVVDASGSMGARSRLEAARTAVLALLVDAYQRRDRVAMVTFRGDSAETVLRPTGSTEIARARLADMATGGRTPLAAGIRQGLAVAIGRRNAPDRPLLVVVTDGRATCAPAGRDPLTEALEAAAAVRGAGVDALVVDVEAGSAPLGLAALLAAAMGARRIPVGDLSADALVTAVRAALA